MIQTCTRVQKVIEKTQEMRNQARLLAINEKVNHGSVSPSACKAEHIIIEQVSPRGALEPLISANLLKRPLKSKSDRNILAKRTASVKERRSFNFRKESKCTTNAPRALFFMYNNKKAEIRYREEESSESKTLIEGQQ